MIGFVARRAVVIVAVLSLLGLNFMHTVHAALVTTQTLIEMEDREGRIHRINALLAQGDVREQLVNLGVDPREAVDRVAALTNEELEILTQRLDDMPAGGGVLEIVGITFIVLLILELVGVINIFSRF